MMLFSNDSFCIESISREERDGVAQEKKGGERLPSNSVCIQEVFRSLQEELRSTVRDKDLFESLMKQIEKEIEAENNEVVVSLVEQLEEIIDLVELN